MLSEESKSARVQPRQRNRDKATLTVARRLSLNLSRHRFTTRALEVSSKARRQVRMALQLPSIVLACRIEIAEQFRQGHRLQLLHQYYFCLLKGILKRLIHCLFDSTLGMRALIANCKQSWPANRFMNVQQCDRLQITSDRPATAVPFLRTHVTCPAQPGQGSTNNGRIRSKHLGNLLGGKGFVVPCHVQKHMQHSG